MCLVTSQQLDQHDVMFCAFGAAAIVLRLCITVITMQYKFCVSFLALNHSTVGTMQSARFAVCPRFCDLTSTSDGRQDNQYSAGHWNNSQVVATRSQTTPLPDALDLQ